ncbi:hypothetical protein Tco_0326474 [Tanacetum coccineum]
MILKPFKECKYYGFNDYHSDNCEYYHGSELCGSVAHEPANCPKKHPNRILKEVCPKVVLEMTLQKTQKDIAQLIVMVSPLSGCLCERSEA